jgi:hypothetical protein
LRCPPQVGDARLWLRKAMQLDLHNAKLQHVCAEWAAAVGVSGSSALEYTPPGPTGAEADTAQLRDGLEITVVLPAARGGKAELLQLRCVEPDQRSRWAAAPPRDRPPQRVSWGPRLVT